VYRLRGHLLPLVYLNRELRLVAADAANLCAMADIVVVQAEHRQFGLVVDEILDTEEIVVKPLGSQLKGIGAFSGATIMGDGRVALILDILGLAQRAGVISKARVSGREQDRTQKVEAASTNVLRTLLLAKQGVDSQVAIPLALVTRLEGFPASRVKRVGGREVMQYREQIIPLVRLSQVLAAAGASADNSSDPIEVVIYSERGHTIGLVVDRIVDIVEEQAAIDPRASRRGVVGSYARDDGITELLDLPSIVRDAVPGLGEVSQASAMGG
jgi:two-component system chemotaxis sensor kinase CheA